MGTIAAAVSQPPLAAQYNPFAFTAAVQKSEELPSVTNHPSEMPLQSQELQTRTSAVAPSPAFTHSINELKDLSRAINSFKHCYGDLLNHLDSIRDAIMSKLPPQNPNVTPPLQSSSPCRPKIEVSEEKAFLERKICQDSPTSELEGLCKEMCSRGIRRYLINNFSNLPKLRKELPKALKLAPNPAKLVLECLGKFFLQGSKAFIMNSPMIASRKASIFILECFLLMMGMNGSESGGNYDGVLEVEKSVRQEAESAALAWRKRLVAEGGVAKCNQIDARGLLLLVACFGVPSSFKREDLGDLISAANVKEIVGILKNSHVLMDKIPVDINLEELQATLRYDKQNSSNIGPKTQDSSRIKHLIHQRQKEDKYAKRKSRPNLEQASTVLEASNRHKKARSESYSPPLDCRIERMMVRHSPSVSNREENYRSKGDFPCLQPVVEELMSKKDWHVMDSSYKLIEDMLFDELREQYNDNSKSIRQFDVGRTNFQMFRNALLLNITQDAEKMRHLEGQLLELKKDNSKLGVKIESLIDARDQLLDQRQHDLEHARVECATNFLNSVEGKKAVDNVVKTQLTIFRDSQEYRDELTHKAALFYVKGFEMCRQQLLNSQKLPPDFDLSFLDMRADENGKLLDGFDASG